MAVTPRGSTGNPPGCNRPPPRGCPTARPTPGWKGREGWVSWDPYSVFGLFWTLFRSAPSGARPSSQARASTTASRACDHAAGKTLGMLRPHRRRGRRSACRSAQNPWMSTGRVHGRQRKSGQTRRPSVPPVRPAPPGPSGSGRGSCAPGAAAGAGAGCNRMDASSFYVSARTRPIMFRPAILRNYEFHGQRGAAAISTHLASAPTTSRTNLEGQWQSHGG